MKLCSYAVKVKSQPDKTRRELLKAHYLIFCDCWYLSINLTDFCTGNSRKQRQRCVCKRISQLKRMPWVMFSAELGFSCCRPWSVSQHCSQCFICLFALLLVPECTPADSPWQWQIRRGFFKVAAPVSAQRSSCLSFLPSQISTVTMNEALRGPFVFQSQTQHDWYYNIRRLIGGFLLTGSCILHKSIYNTGRCWGNFVFESPDVWTSD